MANVATPVCSIGVGLLSSGMWVLLPTEDASSIGEVSIVRIYRERRGRRVSRFRNTLKYLQVGKIIRSPTLQRRS